jgi:hypothetical protein
MSSLGRLPHSIQWSQQKPAARGRFLPPARCGDGPQVKVLNHVGQELEKTRSRVLKYLEEGQNLLNRMKKRRPCAPQELLIMRSAHAREQEGLRTPAQRLRALLADEQFVYQWSYSLVLLSNLRNQSTKRADLETALSLSVKARKLYVQGRLLDAADLVSKVINRLLP